MASLPRQSCLSTSCWPVQFTIVLTFIIALTVPGVAQTSTLVYRQSDRGFPYACRRRFNRAVKRTARRSRITTFCSESQTELARPRRSQSS